MTIWNLFLLFCFLRRIGEYLQVSNIAIKKRPVLCRYCAMAGKITPISLPITNSVRETITSRHYGASFGAPWNCLDHHSTIALWGLRAYRIEGNNCAPIMPRDASRCNFSKSGRGVICGSIPHGSIPMELWKYYPWKYFPWKYSPWKYSPWKYSPWKYSLWKYSPWK